MRNYDKNSHTFVVCAYQESPYLEDCVRSLMKQTVKTTIVIATSTPNDYIKKIADKYKLSLLINSGEKGIAADWNFAIECAQTSLVTLAHQDDVYDKDYARMMINTLNRCEHPLIAFSDYSEIRNGKVVTTSKLLSVKRAMLMPLRLKRLWKNIGVRRMILALGNAICCPSVTLVKDNLQMPVFVNNMKSNIDWQAWETISKSEGEFAYISVKLMKHRIHAASTTSELLEVNGRRQEDLHMFRKFWPKWFSKVIAGIYAKNEKLNKL